MEHLGNFTKLSSKRNDLHHVAATAPAAARAGRTISASASASAASAALSWLWSGVTMPS
jgi:hypothetical protein